MTWACLEGDQCHPCHLDRTFRSFNSCVRCLTCASSWMMRASGAGGASGAGAPGVCAWCMGVGALGSNPMASRSAAPMVHTPSICVALGNCPDLSRLLTVSLLTPHAFAASVIVNSWPCRVTSEASLRGGCGHRPKHGVPEHLGRAWSHEVVRCDPCGVGLVEAGDGTVAVVGDAVNVEQKREPEQGGLVVGAAVPGGLGQVEYPACVVECDGDGDVVGHDAGPIDSATTSSNPTKARWIEAKSSAGPIPALDQFDHGRDVSSSSVMTSARDAEGP